MGDGLRSSQPGRTTLSYASYTTKLITSPCAARNCQGYDRRSRQCKTTVFLIDDFLAQVPAIPPELLSAIRCWGLPDLLPREELGVK